MAPRPCKFELVYLKVEQGISAGGNRAVCVWCVCLCYAIAEHALIIILLKARHFLCSVLLVSFPRVFASTSGLNVDFRMKLKAENLCRVFDLISSQATAIPIDAVPVTGQDLQRTELSQFKALKWQLTMNSYCV